MWKNHMRKHMNHVKESRVKANESCERIMCENICEHESCLKQITLKESNWKNKRQKKWIMCKRNTGETNLVKESGVKFSPMWRMKESEKKLFMCKKKWSENEWIMYKVTRKQMIHVSKKKTYLSTYESCKNMNRVKKNIHMNQMSRRHKTITAYEWSCLSDCV